jgi:hypothetical protein
LTAKLPTRTLAVGSAPSSEATEFHAECRTKLAKAAALFDQCQIVAMKRRDLNPQTLHGATLDARPPHVTRMEPTSHREQPRPPLFGTEWAQRSPRAQRHGKRFRSQIDRHLGIQRPPSEKEEHSLSLKLVEKRKRIRIIHQS